MDRKGNFSINLTIVADSNKRIRYYNIGLPGSFHDARVVRLSSLDDILKDLPKDYHLIGDSAYGLTFSLLTPYKDNGRLTLEQRSFNYALSSNRMVVENCLGDLKNKYPRVHSMLQVRSIDRAILIVRACIHLLNFLNSSVSSTREEAYIDHPDYEHCVTSKEKRDAIAAYILNI